MTSDDGPPVVELRAAKKGGLGAVTMPDFADGVNGTLLTVTGAKTGLLLDPGGRRALRLAVPRGRPTCDDLLQRNEIRWAGARSGGLQSGGPESEPLKREDARFQ